MGEEFQRGYIAGFQAAIWRMDEANNAMIRELTEMRRHAQQSHKEVGKPIRGSEGMELTEGLKEIIKEVQNRGEAEASGN